MSINNIEVVRRWNAAINAGRDAWLSAIPEFWETDADYYPVRKFPEARPCHGRQEFAEFVARFLDVFIDMEWTFRELVPVGDDRVLIWITLRGEGRGSGITLDGDIYQCMWLRHGRIFRLEDHLTLKGALHALGLEGDTLEATGLKAAP